MSNENRFPMYENVVIRQQPSTSQQYLETDNEPGNERCLLPIQSISGSMNPNLIFPMTGLDFLHDVNEVIIQQSVELNDLFAAESSSRYLIKLLSGQTVYYATESSSSCERTCFGSGRSFEMRLFDRTQQESIVFKRRLGCGLCTFMCFLQRLEVYFPTGEYVGCVQQIMDIGKPVFEIKNSNDQVLYRMHGTENCCCPIQQKPNFFIYNSNGTSQLGSIIQQWDDVRVTFNILLHMPRGIINENKAIILGAAMLLEYMYFQNTRSTSCRCFC